MKKMFHINNFYKNKIALPMQAAFVRTIIFIIMIFMIQTNDISGQYSTASNESPCGGEVVEDIPKDKIIYTWNLGGRSEDVTNKSVEHQSLAGINGQSYTVSVINTDGLCTATLEVSISPASDATVTSSKGNLSFINCINDSNNTGYDLTIQSTSVILANNTNYTIDWGNGSPIYENTNFIVPTHNYEQGYFLLTGKVTGDSSFATYATTTMTNGELNNPFNHSPQCILELIFEKYFYKTTLFPNNYSAYVSAANGFSSTFRSHNFSDIEANPQIEIQHIPPLCGGEAVSLIADPPGGILTSTKGDTIASSFQANEFVELIYTLGTGECEFSETLNTQENPEHSFVESDNMSGQFFAQGCHLDTLLRMLRVRPAFMFEYGVELLCTGTIMPFRRSIIDVQYMWTYDDDITAVGISTVYVSEGEYTISLRMQNSVGCADSLSQTVFFDPVVQSDFTCKIEGDCSRSTVNFPNRFIDAISYHWLFGDGTALVLG